MSDERLAPYGAVVERVEAFAGAVATRRAADMACRAGCDACCRVSLSVAPVEAAAIRAWLAEAGPETLGALSAAAGAAADDRCPMLGAGGRCTIYPVRPLVCRTQGLPLRYPAGFVPAEAVGLRLGERGEATWCPLNFTERAPAGPDLLDAERVDQLLALVNQQWAAASGSDPLERVSLEALAAEWGGSGRL